MLGVLLLPVLASGYGRSSGSATTAALSPLLPPAETVLSAESLPARSFSSQLRVTSPTPRAATFTPPVTAVPAPTPDPLPTMEVRAGDTLVDLAAWFGVSPFDIAATNGVSVDDYLQIGEVLAIPVPASQFSVPPEAVAATVGDSGGDNSDTGPDPILAAPPQPTPVPPTAAPYIPPSSDDVIAAICSLPWPCEQMVRIASCESGLNPGSVNPAGYYGLFQLSEQIAGWEDALTNATAAYTLKYLPSLAYGDGLTPWPVCRYY